MEKIRKYDFRFKLIFLKFFICHGPYPPSPTFCQKWKLGGHDPEEWGILLLWETICNLGYILINLFIYNYIKNFHKNYILF